MANRESIKQYTERVEDIQIRDCKYRGNIPENSIRYDIVKWLQCFPEPPNPPSETPYVLANLEWNDKKSEFRFVSNGLRWLEENPSKNVINMILAFAQDERIRLLKEKSP